MNHSCIKFYIVLCISSISGLSFADSAHQFSLKINTNDVEYDYLTDVNSHNIEATAYIVPVKKTDLFPYEKSAFYTRTGSISISANRTNWKDLNTVIRGRILEKAKSKQYSINTFLAYKNIPLWSKLSYQYIDKMNFYFSDESDEDFKSEFQPIKSFSLGAYIGDNLSFYLTYSKQESKTYGAGIVSLFDLSNFGFLEANIELSKTDRKHYAIFLRHNIEMRISRLTMDEKVALFKFSYFPIPATSFTLAYQQIGFETGHSKNHYYFANINHYLTDTIQAGIHYRHNDDDSSQRYLGGSYDVVGLSLGFDF